MEEVRALAPSVRCVYGNRGVSEQPGYSMPAVHRNHMPRFQCAASLSMNSPPLHFHSPDGVQVVARRRARQRAASPNTRPTNRPLRSGESRCAVVAKTFHRHWPLQPHGPLEVFPHLTAGMPPNIVCSGRTRLHRTITGVTDFIVCSISAHCQGHRSQIR